MATFTRAISVGLRTNKDADTETIEFAEGDQVDIVKTWDRFYLIKDGEGHFYNVPKDAVTPE